MILEFQETLKCKNAGHVYVWRSDDFSFGTEIYGNKFHPTLCPECSRDGVEGDKARLVDWNWFYNEREK